MSGRAQGRPIAASEPLRRAARLVALTFGVVAVAGFLPGLTAHLSRIEPGGWGSGALLLGILRVSVVANLVHATMAGVGMVAAEDERTSRRYLLWGGAAYAVLSVHRLLVDQLVRGGQVPGRGVGEWLPVAVGLAMVLAGVLGARRPARVLGRR